MSNEDRNSNDEQSNNEPSESHGNRQQYVVHVDGIQGTFQNTPVQARELIEVSFPENPTEYDLAALRGESGKEVAVFDPSENIHLGEQHRTHFDTKGDGRNYV